MSQVIWEFESSRADILCYCETWLRPEIENSLVSFPNYEIVRLDRNILVDGRRKPGGGLCTYVSRNLVYIHRQDLVCMTSDLEMLVVEIKNEKCRDMIIFNVYRPLSGNPECAISSLSTKLNEISTYFTGKDIIILGDFNINQLDQNIYNDLLVDFYDEFSLTSMITCPTRVTVKGSSCLDLILVSATHITSSRIILNNISDHYPTFIVKKKAPLNTIKLVSRVIHINISMRMNSPPAYIIITGGGTMPPSMWTRHGMSYFKLY